MKTKIKAKKIWSRNVCWYFTSYIIINSVRKGCWSISLNASPNQKCLFTCVYIGTTRWHNTNNILKRLLWGWLILKKQYNTSSAPFTNRMTICITIIVVLNPRTKTKAIKMHAREILFNKVFVSRVRATCWIFGYTYIL